MNLPKLHKFIVSTELPAGVSSADFEKYLDEAIASWCKGGDPDGPLFDYEGPITVRDITDGEPINAMDSLEAAHILGVSLSTFAKRVVKPGLMVPLVVRGSRNRVLWGPRELLKYMRSRAKDSPKVAQYQKVPNRRRKKA